jgi:hypothetical protein
MGVKEEYTFEDWEQGNIARDYRKSEIYLDVPGGKRLVTSCRPGILASTLNYHGLISERDYQKIRNAQKDAFFIAVDFTERTLAKKFKEKLSKAPNPKKLLEFKIKDLGKIINSAPAHIQEAVYSNDWDESGIDSCKYSQIMDPYNLYSEGIINNCSVMIHLSKPSEVPSDGKNAQSIQSYYKLGPKIPKSPMFKCGYFEFPPPPISELEKNVQNEIYDLTVTYRYLERLRELSKKSKQELEKQFKTNTFDNSQENKATVRKGLTRDEIFLKAANLKKNGMLVKQMFQEIKHWLLEDLDFTEEEIKERFNFSLKDPYSFNRLVTKNAPYHNRE